MFSDICSCFRLLAEKHGVEIPRSQVSLKLFMTVPCVSCQSILAKLLYHDYSRNTASSRQVSLVMNLLLLNSEEFVGALCIVLHCISMPLKCTARDKEK